MASNFGADMKREQQRVIAECTESIRSMAQEAFAEIVQRSADVGGTHGSPVASGRFAGSWRVELNGIDSSAEPKALGYKYPPPSIHKYNANNLPKRIVRNVPASRVAAKLRMYKLGDKIFISNSVPYARRIEGGKHSWQTPEGVLEKTLRQVVKRFRYVKFRVYST